MAHRGLVAVAAVLVLLSSVPLFQVTAVNFTPEDDQSQFDVTLRAPEGTSLAAMNVLANRLGAAVRRIPEVDFTLVTVAGDAAGTQNTAIDAGAPAPDRGPRPRPVRGDGRRCATRSCRRSREAGVRTAVQVGGGPGGGGRRHPVHDPGARPATSSRPTARRCARRRCAIPGLVDVDTTLNAGKPELSVSHRSAQGRRPRRAGVGRRRGAAPAGGRRPGDDLQRGGRAVRGASARARGRSQHRRPRWPACRCRRRGSASSRSTTSPRFARERRPGRASTAWGASVR